MSNIDIVIVALIGIGAVQGVYKGFILSITSLLGLVLGFYIALRFAWYIEVVLREATGSTTPMMHIFAFILCYLLVIILMYIIGKSLEKMLELVSLGCINRLAGGILGILKGIVLVSAIIYVLEIADRQSALITKETKESSLFYKPLVTVVPSLVPQVKKGMEIFKAKTPAIN